MNALARVELQAEVGRRRDQLFELVSTPAGLCRWLDDARRNGDADGDEDAGPRADATAVFEIGTAVRFQLADAIAIGSVLAADAPQHISFGWDWQDEPLGVATVVAFDLIDHGSRTHLTLRHVGLPRGAPLELHEALWRYWFGRLVAAAEREDPEGYG